MIIEQLRDKFKALIEENELYNENILINMRPLKPNEAIGYPKRDDYPLLQGKEVMIEATFKNYKGQAFTDEPFDFKGEIENILKLDLNLTRNRALFVATANAVLRYLKLLSDTIHCKDEEPEECAKIIAENFLENYGKNKKILLIGLQPAIAQNLIKYFSSNNIKILDLDKKNIGKNFNGVIIENGKIETEKNILQADVVLATGSTIVNNTIDDIIKFSNKKEIIFFGVTIAGAAHLLNLNRVCFKAH